MRPPKMAQIFRIVQPHAGILFMVLSATAVFFISIIIYRLFFHSLANVPGPRLAAITNWWSYWYELKGTLPWKVKELQERHNWPSVMRIGPNRVVIHDPLQYEKIYRVGSKFMKDPTFYHHFPSAGDGATTTTATDKSWHADRRKKTMGKLSKQSVGGLHSLVADKLSLLMQRVEELTAAGKSVNVFAGWRSMTLDIISTFAFGTCLDSLHDPQLNHFMLDTMEIALGAFYMFMRVPLVLALVNNPIFNWMFPGAKEMSRYKSWARSCVLSYNPNKESDNLFDTLMDKDTSPRLTIEQIQTEAEDILIAGSDTTATTLTYACIHLARNPELWERLYQEIKPVYGDPDIIADSKRLESLVLLTACIKESLRLASPVPSYLWRSVPQEPYAVESTGKTFVLPAGTSVGMSALVQNYDKGIFPSPNSFNPFRWVGPDNTSNGPHGDLDKYLVTFSKGTRQCGGINLAWMELYMALSTLIMRYKMKGEAEKGKPLVQKDYFVGILQSNEYDMFFERR